MLPVSTVDRSRKRDDSDCRLQAACKLTEIQVSQADSNFLCGRYNDQPCARLLYVQVADRSGTLVRLVSRTLCKTEGRAREYDTREKGVRTEAIGAGELSFGINGCCRLSLTSVQK